MANTTYVERSDATLILVTDPDYVSAVRTKNAHQQPVQQQQDDN